MKAVLQEETWSSGQIKTILVFFTLFIGVGTLLSGIILLTIRSDSIAYIVTGAGLITLGVMINIGIFILCLLGIVCSSENSLLNRLRKQRRRSNTSQEAIASSTEDEPQQPLPSWEIQNPNIMTEHVGSNGFIPKEEDPLAFAVSSTYLHEKTQETKKTNTNKGFLTAPRFYEYSVNTMVRSLTPVEDSRAAQDPSHVVVHL